MPTSQTLAALNTPAPPPRFILLISPCLHSFPHPSIIVPGVLILARVARFVERRLRSHLNLVLMSKSSNPLHPHDDSIYTSHFSGARYVLKARKRIIKKRAISMAAIAIFIFDSARTSNVRRCTLVSIVLSSLLITLIAARTIIASGQLGFYKHVGADHLSHNVS